MQLDIKKAIKSPFNDKKWYLKTGLLFLITVFGLDPGFDSLIKKFTLGIKMINAIFSTGIEGVTSYLNVLSVVLFPTLLFLSVLALGYLLQFSHNEINGISPIIPEWRKNIKKYLRSGFIAFGVLLAFHIIFSILDEVFKNLLYSIFNMSTFNTYILDYFRKIFILIIFCFYSWRFSLKDAFNIRNLFRFIAKAKYELLVLFSLMFLSYSFIHFIEVYLNSSILTNIFLTILNLILINLLSQIIRLNVVEKQEMKLNELFTAKNKKYWLGYGIALTALLLLVNLNPKYQAEKSCNKINAIITPCVEYYGETVKPYAKLDKVYVENSENYCSKASNELKNITFPQNGFTKNEIELLNKYKNYSINLCEYISKSYEENEIQPEFINDTTMALKVSLMFEKNPMKRASMKKFLKKLEEINSKDQ